MGLSKFSDLANVMHHRPWMAEVNDGCGHATIEKLTTQMNHGATKNVSLTIVQRRLLRLGLGSRLLVHAPMPTAVHRQRMLEFA
ncbi:hypothetical protein TNCV_486491 [Trichonephila clavipes]|nr:hypothetical protein TNCV_486491 [Trichonephila clavipes]